MAGALETGAVAALFAATFAAGGRLHPPSALMTDRRGLVSFSSGMAAAYVFVHVMPELHEARRAITESASALLRFEGMSVYFVALVGFLVFYGMEHLRRAARGDAGESGHAFLLHVGGFAAYVALMSYLLAHKTEDDASSIALYGMAVAAHFLAVDHALRHEHGEDYDRAGRWWLAAMSLTGWAAGMLYALPNAVIAMLLAFVSGAVIMNSLIMELPTEKDGRFLPFLAGGAGYGAILLPLG